MATNDNEFIDVVVPPVPTPAPKPVASATT